MRNKKENKINKQNVINMLNWQTETDHQILLVEKH